MRVFQKDTLLLSVAHPSQCPVWTLSEDPFEPSHLMWCGTSLSDARTNTHTRSRPRDDAWGWHPAEHRMYAQRGSVVNRFPSLQEIVRKRWLTKALTMIRILYPQQAIDFFPPTFLLPDDIDHVRRVLGGNQARDCRFLSEPSCYIDCHVSKSSSATPYILKPDAGTQGIGVKLVSCTDDVPADILTGNYVMQQYIKDPVLLNGKKFDLRVYVLLTRVDPDLEAYVATDGLARFCTVNYAEPSIANMSNVYMHLTNFAVNRTNRRQFVQHSDIFHPSNSKRPLSAVFEQLRGLGYTPTDIWKQMITIIQKTLIALHPLLMLAYHCTFQEPSTPASRCFQILGFDILIDQTGKVWLLGRQACRIKPHARCKAEVNSNPSLRIAFETSKRTLGHATRSAIDEAVKVPLLRETLRVLGTRELPEPYIPIDSHDPSHDGPDGSSHTFLSENSIRPESRRLSLVTLLEVFPQFHRRPLRRSLSTEKPRTTILSDLPSCHSQCSAVRSVDLEQHANDEVDAALPPKKNNNNNSSSSSTTKTYRSVVKQQLFAEGVWMPITPLQSITSGTPSPLQRVSPVSVMNQDPCWQCLGDVVASYHRFQQHFRTVSQCLCLFEQVSSFPAKPVLTVAQWESFVKSSGLEELATEIHIPLTVPESRPPGSRSEVLNTGIRGYAPQASNIRGVVYENQPHRGSRVLQRELPSRHLQTRRVTWCDLKWFYSSPLGANIRPETYRALVEKQGGIGFWTFCELLIHISALIWITLNCQDAFKSSYAMERLGTQVTAELGSSDKVERASRSRVALKILYWWPNTTRIVRKLFELYPEPFSVTVRTVINCLHKRLFAPRTSVHIKEHDATLSAFILTQTRCDDDKNFFNSSTQTGDE